MDRRNFFKLVGTTSGAVVTGACGNPAREIVPLLVPEKEIVPGIEEWHPSVCRGCSAGCGTIVRVMEAERVIEREGEKLRERIAAIKKIEGNPLDPVSGGRLCARGQAAVQSLYHPDRLRGPLRRVGERGEGSFEPIGWEEALEQAGEMLRRALASGAAGILYLSRPGAGTRSATVARFLEALGAPPAMTDGFCDFSVEHRAAAAVFGWDGLPHFDLGNATVALGIGADFLGTWASPVYYARRFGHFRRGRRGLRGRLLQAESRFSQTAWSADEWLPLQPGSDLAFALALGHQLTQILPPARLEALPETVRRAFETAHYDRAVALTGLPAQKVERAAEDLASAAAPVVIAGASSVHTNSLAAISAAYALNYLLGRVGRAGGVLPPAPVAPRELAASRPRPGELRRRLSEASLLLLDGANPAYALPGGPDEVRKPAAIISFSPFLDESSALADLILPDHDALESAAAVVPEVAPQLALTGAPPFVAPLGETRATEEVLGALAKAVQKEFDPLPVDEAFEALHREWKEDSDDWESAAEFAVYSQRQGGWWEDVPAGEAEAPEELSLVLEEAVFEGETTEYPLILQPYATVQFGEGGGARLPWLQELPDPASSAMWNLPAEIDPRTAEQHGIHNGDRVRVSSRLGSIEALAYVHPAAIPGVLSMGVGQGRRYSGRYAEGRGVNPLSITAPIHEPHTQAPAFGATRVRIERIGPGRLTQFARVDREPHAERR